MYATSSKQKSNEIMGGSAEEFWIPEIAHISEILAGKLYFGVTHSPRTIHIKNTEEDFYFNIDDKLTYMNYYLDFGPLNISCLFKYCVKLLSFIERPHINRIIHYTSCNPIRRVNAAFLMGSFAIIYLRMEPKLVLRKLLESGGSFKQFVDASQGKIQNTLKLLDCLQGIQKAHALNFFNFNDFNIAEYDLYDKIQNGDFNWLVPRKFIALIGPIDKHISMAGHAPHFYIRYFLKNDVRTVIRLNNQLYDAVAFEKAGLQHHDLFFPDGTSPPKQILLKFLDIAEKRPGAIAVHCKAGLGRTGSLIGSYIMKHYSFTAREAIAWMRICRPGSVIGQQQEWLEKIENWLWKQGQNYRLENYGDGNKFPTIKYGIYSKLWMRKRLLSESDKIRKLQVLPPSPLNPAESNLGKTKELELAMRKKVRIDDSVQVSDDAFSKQQSHNLNVTGLKKTQGDRLNEIKMRHHATNMRKDEIFNKMMNQIKVDADSPEQVERDKNQLYFNPKEKPKKSSIKKEIK